MSIQAVGWALDQEIRDPWAKLILISLANHADHTTGLCWPSMRLIGKESSCRRETVLRKLPELEAAGFIQIIKARKGDRRRVHTYRLLLPGCAPDAHQVAATRRETHTVQLCAPRTMGCEPAVTTKNRQLNRHPIPNPYPGVREVEGRGLAGKEASPEILQNEVAQRLGRGDVAVGWEQLGRLCEMDREHLTSLHGAGELTDRDIENIRLRLSLDRSTAIALGQQQ
ncbi:hypothetical protein ACVWXN_002696 [Bradyrhizobium sp. i1.4.4]